MKIGIIFFFAAALAVITRLVMGRKNKAMQPLVSMEAVARQLIENDTSGITPESIEACQHWATNLTKNYGEALSENTALVGSVNRLPETKQAISTALKLCLKTAIRTSNHSLIERLQTGYIQLATFQDIDPKDRWDLNQIESQKDIVKAYRFTPDKPEFNLSEEDADLKAMVNSYSKSLPVYNRYADDVAEETKRRETEISAMTDSDVTAIRINTQKT